MFKKAEVRGVKKIKKSTTSTKSLISKPRKEREYKPKNIFPDLFYQTQRKGYGWCEKCKGNVNNALKGYTLICENGHEVILPSSDNYTDNIIDKTKPKFKQKSSSVESNIQDYCPVLFFL